MTGISTEDQAKISALCREAERLEEDALYSSTVTPAMVVLEPSVHTFLGSVSPDKILSELQSRD